MFHGLHLEHRYFWRRIRNKTVILEDISKKEKIVCQPEEIDNVEDEHEIMEHTHGVSRHSSLATPVNENGENGFDAVN